MKKNAVILKTTMSCGKCVAKVKPAFEAAGITENLAFDMASPDKTVAFSGDQNQTDKAVSILKRLGYEVSTSSSSSSSPSPSKAGVTTYKPLIIVALFLIGITALVEIKVGAFDSMRAMNVFMGGFFIFFSFFKFLGLKAFADAFATYDLIAKYSRAYALAYPFIELALGIGFILGAYPLLVNGITIVLMVVGNLGVWRVLRKKQTIQCACLGTVFNLPMTKVTMVENTIMLIMSTLALLSIH